jgi:hypothetical protein
MLKFNFCLATVILVVFISACHENNGQPKMDKQVFYELDSVLESSFERIEYFCNNLEEKRIGGDSIGMVILIDSLKNRIISDKLKLESYDLTIQGEKYKSSISDYYDHNMIIVDSTWTKYVSSTEKSDTTFVNSLTSKSIGYIKISEELAAKINRQRAELLNQVMHR